MSRHSKNNTALAFFTKSELEKLDYGTKRERLGRDSMRNFDACFLCLQSARDPLCCLKGHLACKECFYENMLAQKIANNRKGKEYLKHLKKLEDNEIARKKIEEAEKIARLGRMQTGIGQGIPEIGVKSENGDHNVNKKMPVSGKELPSFWIPSLAPNASPSEIGKPDTKIYCMAEKKLHEISMKKLFPVKFTPQSTSGESGSCGQVYSCPACLRPFNNGVKMAVLRECGHVICRSCISEFVKLSSKCYTCEKRCRPKDILPLYVEGTGFSKVGNVQAQKEAAAFQ